jgi:hypothetical protein
MDSDTGARHPPLDPMPIELEVNGIRRSLDVDPSTPLLWVLRDELRLTRHQVRLRHRAMRCLHRARRRLGGARVRDAASAPSQDAR